MDVDFTHCVRSCDVTLPPGEGKCCWKRPEICKRCKKPGVMLCFNCLQELQSLVLAQKELK